MKCAVLRLTEPRIPFLGRNSYRENIIIPKMYGAVQIKTNEEKLVEAAFESCAFKSLMSCVLGYGLGAAIGLFSSSVNPNISDPLAAEKQQTAREIFREMRQATHSYGKNFAVIGAVFAAVECVIESVRTERTKGTPCSVCSLIVNNLLYYASETRSNRLEKWYLRRCGDWRIDRIER